MHVCILIRARSANSDYANTKVQHYNLHYMRRNFQYNRMSLDLKPIWAMPQLMLIRNWDRICDVWQKVRSLLPRFGLHVYSLLTVRERECSTWVSNRELSCLEKNATSECGHMLRHWVRTSIIKRSGLRYRWALTWIDVVVLPACGPSLRCVTCLIESSREQFG